MSQNYAALAAFYATDDRRRHSRETDLGLWWRGERGLPSFRAAWVEATGEVYIVQHGPAPGAGQVTVLGSERNRSRLMRRLGDWRAVCGTPGSLQWLRGHFSPA
jgi:hypothetical protein